MALKVVNLGFHSLIPCCHSSTFVPSPKPLKDQRFIVRCSQVEQISLTESENSLIEALLGIQGRGRSSSPQQLNVRHSVSFARFFNSFPNSPFILFLFCFSFQAVERAVQVLERLGGVPDPVRLQFRRILGVFTSKFLFQYRFLSFLFFSPLNNKDFNGQNLTTVP